MGLSVEQLVRMSALLDEAMALDEAGQRRWLEGLGAEHQDLAPALHAALSPNEQRRSDLQRLATMPKFAAVDQSGNTAFGARSLASGERVGPYELVRRLGAGGMAEVWLSRRADGAYQRDVALKLPMLSRYRQDLAQRFTHERDILASLEHINIARLYDAGVTPEGLPYLAMEYVAGQPLTTWCDAHKLHIRERIRLFLQVLDAVQYAHARHVIHRDIKPSNILVTDSGEVRLLDFGVAKLLEEDDQQTQLTQLYGRALTPDYASPEYLLGQSADIASDVYSLGVVLYELLAGNRPYRLNSGGSETGPERAITEAPIKAPSTQLSVQASQARASTPGKLAKRLRGDLDAIVLKALARDPANRFATAESLADELQRYLSGEPIHVRSASLLYRTGKLILRHRIGVVICAMAALTISLTAALVHSRGTTAPGDSGAITAAADVSTVPTALDRSIAVLPFVDMSEKKDQEYFADGMTEEILDSLARIPELRVTARTSSFYFKGKQATIRDISRALGVVHLLEGSIRKSGDKLRITTQLVRADNGYQLWSQTFDRRPDDIFKIQDEIAEAVVKELRVSLLQGGAPKVRGTQNAEAKSLAMQAKAMFTNANTSQEMEKVVGYVQRAIKLDPSYADAWALLGNVRIFQASLGWRPAAQGWDEGRHAVDQALKLDPMLPYAHNVMANIVLLHDWNWAAAESQIQESLSLNPNGAGAMELAGYRYRTLGELDKAILFGRKANDLDPLDPQSWTDFALTLYFSDKLDDALDAIQKALDLNSKALDAHAVAGDIFLLKGDPARALAEFDQENDEQGRQSGRAIAYYALDRKMDADSTLSDYKERFPGVDAYGIAQVHAFRKESDEAFSWLDRAYRQHEPSCVVVKSDPLLRNIRTDPRYKAFLRKMKLPD